MNYYQLLYARQLDELIAAALPNVENDKDAARAYLRCFITVNNMWLLSEQTVKLLQQEADKGNRYAQYGYARYHSGVRPDENSLWESFRYGEKAMEQGLPDALALVATSYEYGDIGNVDKEKAAEMMKKAFDQGSEYAIKSTLQNMIYGKPYEAPQPEEEVVALIEELMAKDKQNGIEPNGWLYYYRACAKEGRIGRTRVEDDYEKAAALGVNNAYTELAISYGYGDEFTSPLIESDKYKKVIADGIAHRNGGSYFMDFVALSARYEALLKHYAEKNLPADTPVPEDVDECSQQMAEQLRKAYNLGYNPAIEQIGDVYYNGMYGYPEDYEMAFSCYSRAAFHDSVTATEQVWQMMHDHLIDRPLDYVDSIALLGARLGSKKLLAETVVAHQEGRLNEFADEIEKYYEPIFDADDFTIDEDLDNASDDDDYEEDDGRYDAWA